MEETSISEQSELLKPLKPKKRHRILKFIIGFLIFIAIGLFALNIAFPGLITTRDLGVKYTTADYESATKKLATIKDILVNLQNIEGAEYGQTKDINISLTSAEITAFVNTNNPISYAANNFQVMINKNNEIEATGSVNVQFFLTEMLDNKVSKEQILEEMPVLSAIPANVNLYIKFNGEIISNKSSMQIKEVSVQGIPVPTEYVNTQDAVSTLTSGIDSFLSKNNVVTGSSIDSLKLNEDKVSLIGKFPSTVIKK